VPCYAGSCSEIYKEKAFVDAGFFPKQRLPEAVLQGETSLMFLIHPTLSDTDMEDICKAVAKVMAVAVKQG
jgi:dTDP-4-amino-4,6-dideoxygalactose transaminase